MMYCASKKSKGRCGWIPISAQGLPKQQCNDYQASNDQVNGPGSGGGGELFLFHGGSFLELEMGVF